MLSLFLKIIKLILLNILNIPRKYQDDLLNIDNLYFEQMIGEIYPTECQLNKVNSFESEASFFDLDLSITHDIVSSEIYEKRLKTG